MKKTMWMWLNTQWVVVTTYADDCFHKNAFAAVRLPSLPPIGVSSNYKCQLPAALKILLNAKCYKTSEVLEKKKNWQRKIDKWHQ